MERDQQFAGLQVVAAWSGAEVFDRDPALASGAGDTAGGLEGDQQRHGVGTGGGVAEVAADGGAALDLDAADECRYFRQSWVCLCDRGVSVDAITGSGGA